MASKGQWAIKISAQGQKEAQRGAAFAAVHTISRSHGMTGAGDLQSLATGNHARDFVHGYVDSLKATHGSLDILGHANVINNAGTSG